MRESAERGFVAEITELGSWRLLGEPVACAQRSPDPWCGYVGGKSDSGRVGRWEHWAVAA